jgi:hypothetical protein
MSTNTGISLPNINATSTEIIVGSARTWTSIDSSYDGTKLIACVSKGFVYTSTNSGVTWTARLTNVVDRQWSVVASSYDGTVLAAVYNDTSRGLFVSTNSGVSWSQRLIDKARYMSGVSISSNGSIIFACGNYLISRAIFKSTDSGVNWTETTVGGTLQWTSIKVSSNGNYVIAGSNAGGAGVYTSSDSGLNWKREIDSTARDYTCVATSDDGKFLCAGTYPGIFYASNNSGLTWETRPNFTNPASISLSRSGNKLVMSVTQNNRAIYESNDLGVTSVTRMTPGRWSCVKILASNENIILVTQGRDEGSQLYNGNIFKLDVTPPDIGTLFNPYTSGGKRELGIYQPSPYNNWIKQTASGNKKWKSITSSSDGVKLAACVLNEFIYTSNDSGTTWIQKTNSGSQSWTSITSSPDGSILTACVENGYIWRSTDSGESWTQQASIGNWRSITSSSDGTKIFACEFGQYIWRSINSGVRWNARVDLYDWTSIVCSSNGLIVAATIGNGNIWISNDAGNTWSEKTSAGSRNWSSITSSSNGNILAACVNGGYIYTSTNSGQTWRENTSSGSRNWYGISSSSNGLILSACANNDYIYTSKNAGESWVKEELSVSNNWYSIASSSLGIIVVACAQDDYIYRQSDPTQIDIGLNFNLSKSTDARLSRSTGILKNEKFLFNTINIVGPLAEPLPTSNTTTIIYNISSSSDGTKLVACRNSAVFISTDSGRTWNIIPSTFESIAGNFTNYDNAAISGDGNVIAVIGGNQYLYISTNGGNTWLYRNVSSNNGGGSRLLLNYDGSKMLLGGAYTYTSTNGGNTWQLKAGGNGTRSEASDDLNVFIVNGSGNMFIFRNDVSQRLGTFVGVDGSNQYRLSLSSTGEKIGIIHLFGSVSTVYLSNDIGYTFTTVTNLPTSTPAQVWRNIALSSDGMTITICSYNRIARSTDFGASWSIILDGTYNWFYITSKVPTNIVASNNYGLTYVSTDSGVSNQLVRMPNPARILVKGIAFSYDGTKIGAVVDNGIYISTDKGKSWNNTTISMPDCFDMNSSYDFSVLIVDLSGGNVITSTDSGVNWMIQTTLGSKSWTGSCVSGDGNVLGVCQSSGYIWISNDKGQTWNQRAESATWRYIKSSYNGTILVAGRSNNQLWRSTDSGVNWGPITNSPTITGNWGGLYMSSDGSQLIACDQVRVAPIYYFKSIDYGVTWMRFLVTANLSARQVSNGLVSDTNYFAGSADGKVIITGRNYSMLHVSGSSGYTWLARTISNDAKTYRALGVSGDGTVVAFATNTYYEQFAQFYLSSDASNEAIDMNIYYEKK